MIISTLLSNSGNKVGKYIIEGFLKWFLLPWKTYLILMAFNFFMGSKNLFLNESYDIWERLYKYFLIS